MTVPYVHHPGLVRISVTNSPSRDPRKINLGYLHMDSDSLAQGEVDEDGSEPSRIVSKMKMSLNRGA